ncbi:MAG TPA: hypothetical protein VGZ26_04350 [Pirellulales bacterium]|jgi:hypothetical protein|nr:hypothetical protein [Pirellulales bacterium]
MNARQWMAATIVFAICGAALLHFGAAAPPSKNDKKAESNEVRSARAKLRLAELTLQKAQDMNRKVAGTLTPGLIAQFADDVEFAKLQLQNATRPDGRDAHQAYLLRAELVRHAAENQLKRATEANGRVPDVIPASELERLRLNVEIAKLRVERGQSLIDASPDAKLQWQIDLMSDELARVKEQTYLLGQNRLQQF